MSCCGRGRSIHEGRYSVKPRHLQGDGANALNKDSKIAIVGAGPSGLLTARWLKRQGYQNVIVFERQSTLGGHNCTEYVDDHAFDLSIKYIPSTNARGMGPHKAFKSMVDDYKMKFSETPSPVTLNVADGQMVAVPACLKDYSSAKIITDMVRGFTVVRSLAEYPAIGPLLDADPDIVRKGETLKQWGERQNLQAFAALCGYLIDVFGAGPNSSMSAAFCLSYREHYMTSYLARILRDALNKASGMAKLKLQIYLWWNAHPHLKDLLALKHIPPLYVFEDGYEKLFQAMVKHEGLDVLLEHEVQSATLKDGSWNIKTPNHDHDGFAAVIMTTPPAAYANILTGDAHRKVVELMQRASTGIGPEVYLFRVKEWNKELFGGDRGAWVISEQVHTFGTNEPLQCASHIYALAKDYVDSNIIGAVAYPDEKLDEAAKKEQLKKDIGNMGMEITEVIRFRRFRWPSHVGIDAENEDWHANMDNLQGVDCLFCIGEALFSTGIMSAVDGVDDFCNKFFRT